MRPLITTLLWAGLASRCAAHTGPPYAVLVDAPIPGGLVSVWADPDVGTGTFYVMIERTGDTAGASFDPAVEIRVRPANARLPWATYRGERQALDRIQFLATPAFDREERWSVQVRIAPPGQVPHEWSLEVEATPDGIGPGFLVLYMVPFLLFGGLWGRRLLRKGPSRPADRRLAR